MCIQCCVVTGKESYIYIYILPCTLYVYYHAPPVGMTDVDPSSSSASCRQRLPAVLLQSTRRSHHGSLTSQFTSMPCRLGVDRVAAWCWGECCLYQLTEDFLVDHLQYGRGKQMEIFWHLLFQIEILLNVVCLLITPCFVF